MINKTDEWNIGNAEIKSFALGFYVIINYLGVILNAILIWSILRAREKSSRDIFVIGLASGCLMMSAPCATQCLLNFIAYNQSYQYGNVACYFEAYFHVSAIMVQFFSIMMIAWSSFEAAVRRKIINNQLAAALLFIIWVTESIGTAITSQYSAAILMPAGAYCFFDFTSIVIVWWFTPTMLITLGFTIYFYIRIFNLAKSSIQFKVNNVDVNPEIMTRKVALRSSIFVLTYFIGWFPAVVACFYAVTHGSPTEFLDVFLAIAGSLNSIWQPIAYGIYNRNLQKLIGKCIPACRENLNLEVVHLRGRETVITVTEIPRTPGNTRNIRNNSIKYDENKILEKQLLPGQVGEVSNLSLDSPTKTGFLSTPPSPEKRSPESYRNKWPTKK